MRPFADLRAIALRHARHPDEAEDLLQSALLAAVEAGRSDMSCLQTRRWLAGVIRRKGAFEARTAGRRKRRETAWSDGLARGAGPAAAETPGDAGALLPGLSPALRVTGLLVMNGCTREEIGWLLNLPDTALRKRLSDLRRVLQSCEAPGQPRLTGTLSFGALRRSLLAAVRRPDALLASHDPDGHLFVLSRSQITPPRQLADV